MELKTNEYWGRRSGFVHPIHGPIFLIRRGSRNSMSDNKGPTGYKLRRVSRNYSNLKLKRKHFNNRKFMELV